MSGGQRKCKCNRRDAESTEKKRREDNSIYFFFSASVSASLRLGGCIVFSSTKPVSNQCRVYAVIVVARSDPVSDLFYNRMSVVHGDRDAGELEHADVVGGVADGHHLREGNAIMLGG